jgi:hypothetical protein
MAIIRIPLSANGILLAPDYKKSDGFQRFRGLLRGFGIGNKLQFPSQGGRLVLMSSQYIP